MYIKFKISFISTLPHMFYIYKSMKHIPRKIFSQPLSSPLFIVYLSVLFLLCSASATSTSSATNSTPPIKLTQTQYEKFITTNSYCFVYFYTQNCNQCIPYQIQFGRLAKEYDNLTKNSSVLNNTKIYFGKVDGSEQKKLIQKYNIKQFPVLFFIDETFLVKYDGESGKSMMFKWLQKYLTNRIQSLQDNVRMLEKLDRPYILLRDPTQIHEKIVNKAIYNLRNPIIKTYKLYSIEKSNFPSSDLKLSITFKNRTVQYNGQLQRISIKKWLQQETKTSISPVHTKQETDRIMFNQQLPALLLVLPNSDRLNTKNYQLLIEVCDIYIGRLICGEILEHYSSYKGAHGYFKQPNKQKAIIGIVKKNMNIAYKMNMPYIIINKQSLVEFIDSCLEDKHQRIVDNVAPEKVSFSTVQVVDEEKLNLLREKQQYVFVNYYDSSEEGSLFFSRLYEAFANNIKSQEKVNKTVVVAVDCGEGGYKCKRKFQYFPYLLLYINGIEVQYEKTPKVPEVPQLIKFLLKKIERKYHKFIQQQSTTYKIPYVVLESAQISKQLSALPALADYIQFYHKKSQNPETYQLHLYIYEQAIPFPTPTGKDSLVNQYSYWLEQETSNILMDVLSQVRNERILKAVNNKEPILVLLDFDKQNSKEYRTRVGIIAKKLGICGAYADSSKPTYMSFYNWIGVENNAMKNDARVVYADTGKDVRYIYYAKSVDEITLENMNRFLNNIKKFSKQKSVKVERQDSQRPKIQNQQL